MGVVGDPPFRIVDAHLGEEFAGHPPGHLDCDVLVHPDGFHELGSDGLEGIQGSHRVLEYQADVPPPDLGDPGVVKAHELCPVELDAAAHNAARWRNEPHEGHGEGGFPGTRFADDRQSLPFVEVEGHVPHRVDGSRGSVEVGC